MTLLKMMKDNAGTGEIVTLAYAGGSRPGEAREVAIVSCDAEKAVIREPNSRFNKTYKFKRILWVEDRSGSRIYNEQPKENSQRRLPILRSLRDYSDLLAPRYERGGWHVESTEDCLSVGTFFKNGKPKKTPSIAITFFDRTKEEVWDDKIGDFKIVERRLTGRERPWRIDSWRFKEGKTYRGLDVAMEVFAAEVEESNPESAKGMFAGH